MALKRKQTAHQQASQALEGVIHTADVRGKLEDPVKTLELLAGMAFPVGFLVGLCGSEQTGEMLEDGIGGGIVLKAEFILDADPQVIHALVQQADDMEVVIADDGPGETGRGELSKAGMYVTADEADFGALFERELEEVIPEGAMVDGGEDVKDSAEVSVGNVAVVFIGIVAFPGGIPGTRGALELIDADGLGSLTSQSRTSSFITERTMSLVEKVSTATSWTEATVPLSRDQMERKKCMEMLRVGWTK